jgi:hypothetical protein
MRCDSSGGCIDNLVTQLQRLSVAIAFSEYNGTGSRERLKEFKQKWIILGVS